MRSLSRIGNAVYPTLFSGAKSVRNCKLLWGLKPRQLYKQLRVSKMYQGTLFFGEPLMDIMVDTVTSWRYNHIEQKN